jgi:hypothetical protein
VATAGATGGKADTAEKVVKNTWVEPLARVGYLARGVVYILVGLLALMVALGLRGATEGKTGALATIAGSEAGRYLLVALALGLAGYSLWGFVRAIFDPMRKGKSPKGLAERAGFIVSAVSYGALILPAMRLAMGDGTGASDNQSAEQGTAWLLAQPLGEWLVIVAGVIGMIGGAGQLWAGVTARFAKDFRPGMDKHEHDWAVRFGRFGYIARGVVFAMAGFFLVRAALTFNPTEAQGLDENLATLARQPYGTVLLGLVALGLVSFGIYSILCMRWIEVIKPKE